MAKSTFKVAAADEDRMQHSRWIREALRRQGLTQFQLCEVLGISPSGVSRLLSGERRLQAHELGRVMHYLKEQPPPELMPKFATSVARAPCLEEAPSGRNAKTLPLYRSQAEASGEGFKLFDQPVDFLPRPCGLAHAADAFAFYVVTQEMMPRFCKGELIFIHPGRLVLSGCSVIVELRRRPPQTSLFLLRQLVEEKTAGLELLAWAQGSRPQFVAHLDIVRTLRVMTTGELFGV